MVSVRNTSGCVQNIRHLSHVSPPNSPRNGSFSAPILQTRKVRHRRTVHISGGRHWGDEHQCTLCIGAGSEVFCPLSRLDSACHPDRKPPNQATSCTACNLMYTPWMNSSALCQAYLSLIINLLDEVWVCGVILNPVQPGKPSDNNFPKLPLPGAHLYWPSTVPL